MLRIFKKTENILKKVLLVVVVYLFVIGLFMFFIKKDVAKISFQDPNIKQRTELYKTINDPELSKTAIGKLSISLYRFSMCKIAGEACTDNPADGDINVKKSLVGQLTNIFMYPYTHQPVSGVSWVYYKLQDTGFVPKSYASEGIGFAGIKPLIGIWTAFRNITYMLLVLVLIAIGFMIMFRMKLNPQTVISVENALPKIVLSMILITFSFAIAGFLIDLMYVLMAIGIAVIGNNNLNYDIKKYQTTFLTAGMGELYSGFFVGKDGLPWIFIMGNAIFTLLGDWIGGLIKVLITWGWYFLSMRFLHFIVAQDVGKVLTDVAVQAATFGASVGHIPEAFIQPILKGALTLLILAIGVTVISPFIVGFLVLITIVGLFFRLFFLLFKAYIQILLYVLFSPFYLLMEAIPGSKTGFQTWFINLFAEVMTFPVVAVVFCIGYVIANTLAQPTTGTSTSLWTPPFISGLDPQAFTFIMGMTLLLLMPSLIKKFKELIGAKDMGLDFGFGTLFGGGQALASGGMGLVGGFSSIALAFPGLRSMIPGAGSGFIGNLMGTAQKDGPTEKSLLQQLVKTAGGDAFAGEMKKKA